ncbi:hypothetical protein CBR64_20895 [Cellulosimicrobium cellulans]|uniref:Uncharacterized protein n=1 Tax=Cellulosimicrobium cellulans TaxID=1710 RepID=A0A1Y0HZA4_CELCE|nr:hypothetical protein [Cellulosimicrobium cellulans]ARU53517.1 hypothetical protein CBR64_20895 [Cellulosimicrobium cellulans]
MPTTLTLTALPDDGALQLVLVAPDVDWELVQLVRTDANGSRAVRLLAGAGLTGGTLIHTDAETALTGPVTYSATVRDPGDDSTETATASVDVSGVFARTVVGSVVIPAQSVELDPLGWVQYSARRSTSGTVTDVIGRADPVVSIGVQRTRRGRLTIWCRDYAQARAVEAAYGVGWS